MIKTETENNKKYIMEGKTKPQTILYFDTVSWNVCKIKDWSISYRHVTKMRYIALIKKNKM